MKSYFVYILARSIILFFRIIPRSVGVFLVRSSAYLAYYLDRPHRRIAYVNLKIAFPDLTDAQRAGIARKSFQNTALNLLEISRIPFLNRDTVASLVQYDPVQGIDNFLAAQAMGKGILYLTGHFSAWELLPLAHALFGHPLSFVTRPLDNTRLERYMRQLRESRGNRVIDKNNAMRPILKCLQAKESVGILMDHNTSLQEGIFSELFGLPAATTTGIVLLALRTGAPVLPGYLTPLKKGRYTIKFLPLVEIIRTGDKNRDVEINTGRLNKVIENIIREQPESWLWGHKRWKYQPPENPRNLYELSDDELERFLNSKRNVNTEREI